MMLGLVQESLSRVGIDPSAALARARSQSRGRKRTRSEAPADVEMADAEQQKRLHSSKSRCCCLLAMKILSKPVVSQHTLFVAVAVISMSITLMQQCKD